MQTLSFTQFLIICAIFLCTVCILSSINSLLQLNQIMKQAKADAIVLVNAGAGAVARNRALNNNAAGMNGNAGINDNDEIQVAKDNSCHFSLSDYVTYTDPTGFDETDMNGMRPAPIIPAAVPNQVADATGANFFVGKDGCDHFIRDQ